MDVRKPVKELLAEVKYVAFYSAMIVDDYELSGLSVEDYVTVLLEFKKQLQIKTDGVSKQLELLQRQILVLTGCLIIFPTLGADEENLEIAKNIGVELDTELDKLLNNVQKVINKLVTKYSLLSGTLPDMGSLIKPSGEDMIAELSLSIEMMLPMDISLLEYISYFKAARKRSEAINKAHNGEG